MIIFIEGNVPSSKNTKMIIWTGNKCRSCNRGTRPLIINGKTTERYVKASEPQWIRNKLKFQKMVRGEELPLRIKFTFIRDTKRKFDVINAQQIVQDLMVKYKWIEDDNMTILLPSFGEPGVDKENAGVIIELEENF